METQLLPVGPEIWVADGPAVTAAMGFQFPTRMAVIRLADGKLFLWSPVALTEALRADLDRLGTVSYIVAPNALHHVFLQDWVAACPLAQVVAAPGLVRKRQDIAFDFTLGTDAAPAWAGEIDQAAMTGNQITTEVVFFHAESRTVLFADLLQQMPRDWFTGWRRVIARLDLMSGTTPHVPRKFRLAFTDRRAARASVSKVLEWPIERILMAHGPLVEEDGRAVLQRAFRWLTG